MVTPARGHGHRQDDDDGQRRSSASSGRRWSWPTTRRWPRSCATSSAATSPTTRSSTSSPTTTTTSPRPTSRRKDLYIEKDSAINEEIDRLRHAATAALFGAPRRDHRRVGVGDLRPRLARDLQRQPDRAQAGGEADRDALLRKLVTIQYTRNDQALGRGTFRVRGESLEVFPAYAENTAYRATFFGDEVELLQEFDPMTGEVRPRRHRAHRHLARVALQRARGHRGAGGRGDRARAQRPLPGARGARASCSRATACASAPSTTWRCCGRSASATASRTTRASSTDACPASGRTA